MPSPPINPVSCHQPLLWLQLLPKTCLLPVVEQMTTCATTRLEWGALTGQGISTSLNGCLVTTFPFTEELLLLIYTINFHMSYGDFRCASGQNLPSLVLLWLDRICNRETFLLLKRRKNEKISWGTVKIGRSVYSQVQENSLCMCIRPILHV